jgi:hypothetical protein
MLYVESLASQGGFGGLNPTKFVLLTAAALMGIGIGREEK